MQESPLTIHSFFSAIAEHNADKVCLQIEKNSQWQRWTFRQLKTSALQVSAFLLKEGLRKGDFAALILENRPEWAVIYLGIVQAGLACVPFDPQLQAREIESLIVDCRAKVIFISRAMYLEKKLHLMKTGEHILVVLDDEESQNGWVSFSRIASMAVKDFLPPSVEPQDAASLIYTSGTTAKPKGVVLTHYNLCSNFLSIKKTKLILSSDNFLSLLPLYHTYPFMVTLLVPLLNAATVTYCASFKPSDLSRIIKEAGVTILVGVPQLFALIHRSILEKISTIPALLRLLTFPFIKARIRAHFGSSLRLLVSGGARLEPAVARGLTAIGFKIIEGYGLTETSPVDTLNPPQKVKFGSVGRPVPGVEIKIADADSSGVGEVAIKGPNVMKGYFQQPVLTEAVIREGWFYSGDLGYLDKDNYLFLVGRKKDVIVLSSGKNIYPEELEEHYKKSPFIKEICVLSKTEERFGKKVDFLFAVVVADLDVFRQKNEKNIRTRLRWELDTLSKELPGYKHVMGFIVTREELPRTRLNKIKRYLVAQKYLKESVPVEHVEESAFCEEDLKNLDAEIAAKIVGFMSKELKKQVSLDHHLEIDLGIDSLTRVELGIAVEKVFGIKLPDGFMDNIITVRDIITSVQQLLKSGGVYVSGGQGSFSHSRQVWKEIVFTHPSKATLSKIRLKSGVLDIALAGISKYFFLALFRIFWLLTIEGKENIPKTGPYVLCPNHASYLDGFFVFSSLPLGNTANIFFLGHAAIFEHPVVRWAVSIARLIPIDPGLYLTEAMQAAAYVLHNEKAICIFPEGGRSISNEIGEFKKGVGILAQELRVPVIAVYIKNSHYSWPRGLRLPRFCPVKVIFSKPFDALVLKQQGMRLGAQDDYEAITLAIQQEVIKLKLVEKSQ